MATRVTPFNKTSDAGSSGTTQQSDSLSVQAGDSLEVFVKHEGAPTTITVADNKGNVYTSRGKVNHSGGGLSGEVFTATANGTYTDLNITATLAAARNWKGLWTHPYRPTGASLSFHSIATAQGTGTAIATGTYAVPNPGGVAVTFVAGDAGVTYTEGAGWTEQMDDGDYSEDRLLVGSEGTIAGTATGSGSQNWVALSLTLAEPGGTLAAAAADVATASAVLTTQVRAAAAAASAASSSAALSTAIRLAMNAISIASASGTLNAGAVLAASATDVATAVAALTTAVRFSAAAANVATATGGLVDWASVTLVGELYQGVGGVLDPNFWQDDVPTLGTTLYYDPTHIEIHPNGEISSDVNDCMAVVQFLGPNGWALGLIIITSQLVAYARGSAAASAQLTTTIHLAAAANALATAAAAFATGAGLSAAATDQASASASLGTGIPISALAANVATAAGALTAQIKLAAAASGESTATANLNGVISLNAAGQAVASAVANLSAQIHLAGSAQGNASAAGALTAGVRMNATANSVVSAAASLSASIILGGAAHAAAAATADLTTARPLIAAAIDVATAVAMLSTGIDLRANAAAIVQASASLSAAVDLFANATAEASATAELTDVIATPPIGAYEIDPRYVITKPRWSFLPLQVFTPRFNRKDPDESVVLTFDLASSLAANETLQGPITITVRTLAGSDASPSSLQKDVPSYDAARKRILLPVGSGLDGRWYYLKVAAATTNSRKTVSLAGLLPVME